MNQVYKQMIVMLMSIAFIGIVAVLVLSSTAAAGYVDPYTTSSIRDSNLRTADQVLSGDYYQDPIYNNPSSGGYQNDIYTPSQSPIDNSFYDAMEEYKRDRARDDAIVQNGIIRDARREAATEKTPTPRPQPINHSPIDANLDILLLIGFLICMALVFGCFANKTPPKKQCSVNQDMIDEYNRRADMEDIEKE